METRNNSKIENMENKEERYSKTNTKIYYHERRHNPHRRTNTILAGLLIILAGALKIYFNLSYGEPGVLQNIIFSWPMLLVVISLFNFIRKEWLGGTFLLLLGLVFLAPRLQLLFDLHSIWFTLLSSRMVICIAAICFGIAIIISALLGGTANHASKRWERREQYIETKSRKADFENDHSQAHMGIDSSEKVDYRFIFSGAEQYFVEPVFPGGNIKCVFGGMTLDLTHTNLAPGNTYLNIEGTFGGVQLKVPSDWQIEIRSHCVMGGFVDDRHFIATEPIADRKLIINAHCVFGGGNIE